MKSAPHGTLICIKSRNIRSPWLAPRMRRRDALI
jgi:hypothetical protein